MGIVLLVVVGGAVGLVIWIAIGNKIKGSPTKEERPKEERPAGSMYFAQAATSASAEESVMGVSSECTTSAASCCSETSAEVTTNKVTTKEE